jgi:hypothetical protein
LLNDYANLKPDIDKEAFRRAFKDPEIKDGLEGIILTEIQRLEAIAELQAFFDRKALNLAK